MELNYKMIGGEIVLENDFYVYEWYNTDTNEVFYVGKGKGRRYKDVSNRNQYFLNYYNKHNCDVRKVKEHLEENMAFDYEIELIRKYKEKEQCQCNLTEGGEGSTFPEGSREFICAKLRALYNLKFAMDDMINEEDYDPINYKDKSIEELKRMYDDYYIYKESFEDYKHDKSELALFSPNKLNESEYDKTELDMQKKEIKMLTKIIADIVAKKNIKFQDLLHCKNEIDFMFIDIDTEEFISLMLKHKEYYESLLKSINNALKSLKKAGQLNSPQLYMQIRSYNFKNRDINIKFAIFNEKSTKRTKIDLYDIIWGLIVFKEKDLAEIIYEELFTSQIY